MRFDFQPCLGDLAELIIDDADDDIVQLISVMRECSGTSAIIPESYSRGDYL